MTFTLDLHTLGDLLRLLGQEVAIAHDGREGVEKARSFRPDVVLCDLGLPLMSGFEVACALRAEPEGGELVLVALSGYAQPEDVARGREAGFDAHLAKPPHMRMLLEALPQERGVHA